MGPGIFALVACVALYDMWRNRRGFVSYSFLALGFEVVYFLLHDTLFFYLVTHLIPAALFLLPRLRAAARERDSAPWVA